MLLITRKIDRVLLAMPSISTGAGAKFWAGSRALGVHVQSLPTSPTSSPAKLGSESCALWMSAICRVTVPSNPQLFESCIRAERHV